MLFYCKFKIFTIALPLFILHLRRNVLYCLMKNSFNSVSKIILFKPIFLLVMNSCFFDLCAQIEYAKITTQIKIVGNTYTENVIMNGSVVDKKGSLIQINYTDLEKIEGLTLQYYNKKRKKVNQGDFINTGIETSSFFSGLKSLQYHIPVPSDFELSYTRKGTDLMFISTLEFNYYDNCDTVSYELIFPSSYYFKYDVPNKIKGLVIDSSLFDGNNRYTFSLITYDSALVAKNQESTSDYIVNTNENKTVRIQISKTNNPDETLNNWYIKLIQGVGQLNSTSKTEIDSILSGLTTNDEIAKALFSFVQAKIKYIDIEDGISAFKPRNVNEILLNRQGDCKDMSNLLTQALVYKGIDARMALASSLSHRFNLDFPTIASANHVVCVIKVDNEWIELDATDKHCKYLNPSVHTQGRNIFILGEQDNYYHKIKKIPYTENLDSTYSNLRLENGILKGSLSSYKNGLASNSYYAIKEYYNTSKFEDWINKKIKEEYISFNINNIKYEVNSNTTSIDFFINQKNSTITTIKTKYYLPITNLIPFPHQFPKKLKPDEKLITYETIFKKGCIILNFNEDVKLNNNPETHFFDQQLRFDFNTKIIDSKTIELNYTLIIDEVELKDSLVISYNNLNDAISEILNKSIVYEKID